MKGNLTPEIGYLGKDYSEFISRKNITHDWIQILDLVADGWTDKVEAVAPFLLRIDCAKKVVVPEKFTTQEKE